ncbi:hypothetical protein ACEUZ9_002215 [Paracoccus litorisediminis]|uniref:hypothetical protein n=1 Tax=Paracoccus litorisediminis TaxID=2006130 RepID=UPI00372E0F29
MAGQIRLRVSKRGPRGAIQPEDRFRIDGAIEANENLSASMAQVESARGQAVAAAGATAGDRVATGRDRSVTEAAALIASDAAETAAALASVIGTPIGNPLGWQFSRESVRLGWDQAGALEEIPAGQAQGGYSRAGQYLGVLLNKERRNYAANPNMLGAAVGTLAGGAASPPFPTGWTTPTRNSGVSIDVTPITVLGRPGLRLRFYSAAALVSTTVDAIEFAARGAVGAAMGQNWCVSFWYRLVAGSLPAGVTFRSRMLSRNGSGGAVNNANQLQTLDGSWRPAEQAVAMGAAVADVTGGFQISWVAGVQPDFTIEVFAPELFQGVRPTLPALPPIASLGPYTRQQDQVTVPASVLGGYLGRSRGAVFATLTSYYPVAGAAAADWSGIISVGDGTASNLIGLAINPGFTSVEARLISSGVANTVAACALTAPPDGSPFKVGLSWGDGLIQVFARGVASAQVPLTVALPTITQAMIGRLASLFGFDGSLSNLDLRPAPVWGADGAALTT